MHPDFRIFASISRFWVSSPCGLCGSKSRRAFEASACSLCAQLRIGLLLKKCLEERASEILDTKSSRRSVGSVAALKLSDAACCDFQTPRLRHHGTWHQMLGAAPNDGGTGSSYHIRIHVLFLPTPFSPTPLASPLDLDLLSGIPLKPFHPIT